MKKTTRTPTRSTDPYNVHLAKLLRSSIDASAESPPPVMEAAAEQLENCQDALALARDVIAEGYSATGSERDSMYREPLFAVDRCIAGQRAVSPHFIVRVYATTKDGKPGRCVQEHEPKSREVAHQLASEWLEKGYGVTIVEKGAER